MERWLCGPPTAFHNVAACTSERRVGVQGVRGMRGVSAVKGMRGEGYKACETCDVCMARKVC